MARDGIRAEDGIRAAGTSFVEFSGDAGGVEGIARDDVLDYIQEMCASLSYMANAHQLIYLTELLSVAAAEAGRNRSQGADAGLDEAVCYADAVRSDTR